MGITGNQLFSFYYDTWRPFFSRDAAGIVNEHVSSAYVLTPLTAQSSDASFDLALIAQLLKRYTSFFLSFFFFFLSFFFFLCVCVCFVLGFLELLNAGAL